MTEPSTNFARRDIRYYAAGVVLRRADGRLLVLRRADEMRLPKGHIELGEDTATAALRELAEESGYRDVGLVQTLGTATVEFDTDNTDEGPVHVTRVETYFEVALRGDQQEERSSHDQAFVPVWLEPSDALAALTFDAERRWIETYLAS